MQQKKSVFIYSKYYLFRDDCVCKHIYIYNLRVISVNQTNIIYLNFLIKKYSYNL